MTRKEVIERWENDIIPAVFRAEDNIKDKWLPILNSTKSVSKEEKEKVAQSYLHAIAEEIVSKTTNEQLAEL